MKFSRLLLIGTFTLPCIAANDNFSLLFYVPDAQKEASVDAKFHDAAGEVETRYRDDFEDSKHVCMDEGGEGWMANVETGRCEGKPTFTGVARIEGIQQSETREMNITLSDHTLLCKVNVKGKGRVKWTMDFGYSLGDNAGLIDIVCRRRPL